MQSLFCIGLGYALGCLSPAYFISKIRGFDIRTKGTGNAGASNAVILMGWRMGILVGIADLAKGAGAVLAAAALFPGLSDGGILAGVSCVLGHIFPFYLGFQGGKGFASYMGMILAFNWRVGVLLILASVVITVVTDYITFATLFTIISFSAYYALTTPAFIPLTSLGVVLAVVIFKHIPNLRRIIRGEEVGLRGAKSHPKIDYSDT